MFSHCFPSSKLNLPVDHDVLIAAVTHLEQVGFVEETDQRRSNEMVVLRRMMIDLKHDPGVQVVVLRQVRRYADPGSLPHRFLDVSVPDKPRFVREKPAARL